MAHPFDMENANFDELYYFALFGEAGVYSDKNPIETDEVVKLLNLKEPPPAVKEAPEQLKKDSNDEDLPVYRRSYILNFDWRRFPGEEFQDYDKYLEIDENRPTTRMCGLLTMVIFKLLVYLEDYLKVTLEKNMSDFATVGNRILELESIDDLVGPRKRSWLNMFGMPYFKDEHYFPCPGNKDVQIKKQNNELLASDLQQFCDWNAADTERLEKAIVREEIIKRRLRLSKAIDATEDMEKKAELKWKLKSLPSLKQIDKMTSIKEFFEDVEWEYDWLKIAAQNFQGIKHPEECRAAWHICLHPNINRSSWSDEENERLKELAKDYNFQDWDAIAEKLGTNRTPLLVMQHFQRNLNEDFINKTWTEEEDELLVQLVESCKFGSRISWKKIAQQLKGHTKQQIFKHWTYYVNPNLCKGPFSKNEDMLLVAAVRSFGENYGKLSELFPYRSRDQLYSRYKVLKKLHRNTQDNSETEKLLTLVMRFGEGKWEEISEYFSDRTPASLREEYTTLKRRLQQFTDGNHNLSEIEAYTEEEKVSEELKLWRKVQQVCPDKIDYGNLDINGLRELKGILIKDTRMPLQNIRAVTPFDKECYTYFKCVTHPEAMYENDLYENKKKLEKPDVLKYILHLLHAKLEIPDESLLSNNHLIKARDCDLLELLSDESFMVSGGQQHTEDRGPKYCLPPNFITLGGFCSIMLHRRYILEEQVQEKEGKKRQVCVEAAKADCLFKQRFRFLFLLPALASAEPPTVGQLPPIEDPVVYKTEYMVPRKRKKRPARTELLNIFGPRKKQKYTRSKLKKRESKKNEKEKKDKKNKKNASDPSEPAIPSTSSTVDNIHNCTVIEIRDESIYQTLLASEKNKRKQPSTSTTSSSSEQNKKQPLPSTNLTSSAASMSLVPAQAGTSRFNNSAPIRTYSRAKKPKIQAPNGSE